MPKINEKALYRLVDANLNRAKEGARVCEDLCRFVLNDRAATKRFRELRHRLTEILRSLRWSKLLSARDVGGDVGKTSTAAEFNRKGMADIFYANSQRVKESIRVLEELTKLVDKKMAGEFKKIRYQVYALERKVASRL